MLLVFLYIHIFHLGTFLPLSSILLFLFPLLPPSHALQFSFSFSLHFHLQLFFPISYTTSVLPSILNVLIFFFLLHPPLLTSLFKHDPHLFPLYSFFFHSPSPSFHFSQLRFRPSTPSFHPPLSLSTMTDHLASARHFNGFITDYGTMGNQEQ